MKKNTTTSTASGPNPARAGHLDGETLTDLLNTLTTDGWRPEAAPIKSCPARPVHSFTTPSGRIRLELTVFGDDDARRHRLEIAAAHPDNGNLLQPAWTLRAEDLPACAISALAKAAVTGPTGQTPTRRLPRCGWSLLHVHEYDGRRIETRLSDPGRRRTVSFFPADPAIREPAAWLIVRPGFDGAPCATTATASIPGHLVTVLALTS